MTKPWENLPRLPGETALQHCEREIAAMKAWRDRNAASVSQIFREGRQIALTQGDDAGRAHIAAGMAALYAQDQKVAA